MKIAIRCKEVTKVYKIEKTYRVDALSDITLSIPEASIVLIKGPSGSGKTTLLSILATIEKPTSGRVYFFDKDITRYSESALSRLRRQYIGIVFQDFYLIPRLTAWENVSYPLIPLGIKTSERRNRAISILDRLGLKDRIMHTPEQLSGGERQRLSIARALINNPEVIFLDEPTSNIDSVTARYIIDLLKELREQGKTIVLSSHDGDLISEADQVFNLKNGRLWDDT